MSKPGDDARADVKVVRATLPTRQGPVSRRPPSLQSSGSLRPAYVARLLALAHELRGLLDRGEVSGVGELARRLGVSQPRVTQVLNLTRLCPAIQAEVAAMEAVDGVEPMTERPLRIVLREVGWVGQWRRWGGVCGRPSS